MRSVRFLYFLLLGGMLISCFREEDPGPLQQDQREFAILDFDRLDIGEAFVVTIQESSLFSVKATGDRRNLDDLVVSKLGSTLKINYSNVRDRKHTTFLTITLPKISNGSFSGACQVALAGFNASDAMELRLSGASVAQADVEARQLLIYLEGASMANLSGHAAELRVNASGASELSAFTLIADQADVNASGASKLNVWVTQKLNAAASGESAIFYKGNPAVTATESGASIVQSY